MLYVYMGDGDVSAVWKRMRVCIEGWVEEGFREEGVTIAAI